MSAAVRPHYCTDPDVTWGRGRGCPLVVHYWVLGGFAIGAQLASIPRYDDSANGRLGGVCAHCWQVTGGWRGAFSKLRAVYGKWAWLARRWLAVGGGVLNNTAAAWTAGFHWWRLLKVRYTIGPLSVLSVGLSVTLVYCGKTVGWIKMPLG